MTNLTQEVNKFYGSLGYWFCPVPDCTILLTTTAIKKMDSLAQIGWGILITVGTVAFPICPKHGVILEYDPAKEDDADEYHEAYTEFLEDFNDVTSTQCRLISDVDGFPFEVQVG